MKHEIRAFCLVKATEVLLSWVKRGSKNNLKWIVLAREELKYSFSEWHVRRVPCPASMHDARGVSQRQLPRSDWTVSAWLLQQGVV